MKEMTFKTFEQFQQAELVQGERKSLYYSRLFGNRDWGFVISGLFDVELEDSQPAGDYIQVQFLTHDIMYIPATGAVIGNRDRKVMTLRGITEENYRAACEWIAEQRKVLAETVTELTGEYNPLQDILVAEVLEHREVNNDTN